MTQYVTFRLDGALYEIEVNRATRTLRGEDITGMPLFPKTIAGLMNLCNQVATLINLCKRLMLPLRGSERATMMMVMVLGGETLSLMVDSIGGVREIDEGDFGVPPDTLFREMHELILGTCKLSDDLLLVPDVERVVAIKQDTRGFGETRGTIAV